MIYDTDGNRLIRDDGDTISVFLPGTEALWDTNTHDVDVTRYFDHAGQVVAICTGPDIADWTWMGVDHHGTTTTHSVNAFTGVSHVRRMDPYGNQRGPAPQFWPGQQAFVGGIQDPTGLIHIGVRSYEPLTGRFISVDPVLDVTDDQQINGYTYANANPITYTDPTGLLVWTVDGIQFGGPVFGATRMTRTANGSDAGGTHSLEDCTDLICREALRRQREQEAEQERIDRSTPYTEKYCQFNPCDGYRAERGEERARGSHDDQASSPPELAYAECLETFNRIDCDRWELENWFVSVDGCLLGCIGADATKDGLAGKAGGPGCCGVGITAGFTSAPSFDQESSWAVCLAIVVGGCYMTGTRKSDGTRWHGGGLTVGLKSLYRVDGQAGKWWSTDRWCPWC